MAFPTANFTANPASNGPTRSHAAPQRKNAVQRNNRSDAPHQQRTSQKDNPTQLLIKQAVDYLIEQLNAGHSDMLAAYLRTMARFHNYSFGNILQMARQRPTATRVAGFGKWKELGRFVKRGEKGIQILAPVTGYRRRKDEAETETETKPPRVLIGFRAVYVFDIAQTEGADLPEFGHTITGEVGSNRDRLIAFLDGQGIQLEFTENIAPALGVSYGGKIALLPGQSQAEEFTTLVHETAHELLHKAERRTQTNATARETEAEAVAFIVGQAVGLEMGTASSDYIQLYHGNASLLAESLEIIQRAASTILRALEVDDVAGMSTADAEVA
jgi:N-terminal domain of anti-restriction factor ArdC